MARKVKENISTGAISLGYLHDKIRLPFIQLYPSDLLDRTFKSPQQNVYSRYLESLIYRRSKPQHRATQAKLVDTVLDIYKLVKSDSELGHILRCLISIIGKSL